MAARDHRDSPSTFVSIVAWIFIALSGVATVIALFQNVMVHAVRSADSMQRLMAVTSARTDLPGFAQFLIAHVQVFALAFLLVSVVTLIAAIGLLQRKNWARRLFVGIMGLGIAWNIAALFLQMSFYSAMPQVTGAAPRPLQTPFEIMTLATMVVSAIVALALAVFLGWIIARLVAPGVRKEFSA